VASISSVALRERTLSLGRGGAERFVGVDVDVAGVRRGSCTRLLQVATCERSFQILNVLIVSCEQTIKDDE